MVEFASLSSGVAHWRIAAYAAIAAVGSAIGGYAIHEHRAAENLATQNAQSSAALSATQHQISDLSAKVNELAQQNAAQAAARASAATSGAGGSASGQRPAAGHRASVDPRFKKLQSQLDAQGKAIEAARSDLTSTQGDLVNTRTELTGSIAHTHDELVLLEKKGERNYAEFDLPKAKQFKRAGVLELRLKKTNEKHQFADLEMMVNDRNLSEKHINLYQPIMFYTPDSPQPVEVVINDVTKDHIHGYVSSSKYRQSELASMSSDADNGAQGSNQNPQPAPRQKLPLPQE